MCYAERRDQLEPSPDLANPATALAGLEPTSEKSLVGFFVSATLVGRRLTPCDVVPSRADDRGAFTFDHWEGRNESLGVVARVRNPSWVPSLVVGVRGRLLVPLQRERKEP